MSDLQDSTPQQENPLLGYIIIAISLFTLIVMCSKCGDDLDKVTGTEIIKNCK